MKISIEYESSWRNSFLEGSNNEALPKAGRKFIGSMTSLKKPENFIKREITIDTIMGLLNRLIGDQRKLYQARREESYFFTDIESLVSFEDKPKYINNDMTYIRNISGSTDQNSYTGAIQVSDPMFLSNYSDEFWGVLALSLEELCQFIISENTIQARISNDPLTIIGRLEELNKEKPVENIDFINNAFQILQNKFEKYNGLNKKGLVFAGDVYENYKNLCPKTGLRPLTQRRVSDIIAELDMLGIINAKLINLGRYGRTKEITLATPPSTTPKLLKILRESLNF